MCTNPDPQCQVAAPGSWEEGMDSPLGRSPVHTPIPDSRPPEVQEQFCVLWNHGACGTLSCKPKKQGQTHHSTRKIVEGTLQRSTTRCLMMINQKWILDWIVSVELSFIGIKIPALQSQAQNERKGPSVRALLFAWGSAPNTRTWTTRPAACYHVAWLLWQHQTNEWTTSRRQGGEWVWNWFSCSRNTLKPHLSGYNFW